MVNSAALQGWPLQCLFISVNQYIERNLSLTPDNIFKNYVFLETVRPLPAFNTLYFNKNKLNKNTEAEIAQKK